MVLGLVSLASSAAVGELYLLILEHYSPSKCHKAKDCVSKTILKTFTQVLGIKISPRSTFPLPALFQDESKLQDALPTFTYCTLSPRDRARARSRLTRGNRVLSPALLICPYHEPRHIHPARGLEEAPLMCCDGRGSHFKQD